MTGLLFHSELARARPQIRFFSPSSWIAIIVIPIAVCFGSHHADLLNYGLPFIASIVAALLFRTDKINYTRLVLASWFIIPFLRRLIDYASVYTEPSPVLLTAYFVTLAGPLLSLPKILSAPLSQTRPFLLAAVGIACAGCCGVFLNRAPGVVMGALNWGVPVAVGCLLSVDRESAREYWRGLRSSLPILTAATALYTLLQFVVVFPWDASWVTNMDSPSMRSTDPFGIRAFGNLNSPGTCAFVLAFSCLFVFPDKRSWRIPVMVLGLGALATTQVRAGWIVVAVGFVLYMIKNARHAFATIAPITLLMALLACTGLLTSHHLGTLSDRFQTLSDGEKDGSANSRLDGYRAASEAIETHPLGQGLGVPEDVFDVSGTFSLRDSGIVDALVTLGWFGAAAYFMGIAELLLAVLMAGFRTRNGMVLRLGFPAISILAVLPLGSVTIALCGVLVWMFLSLGAIYTTDAPTPEPNIL